MKKKSLCIKKPFWAECQTRSHVRCQILGRKEPNSQARRAPLDTAARYNPSIVPLDSIRSPLHLIANCLTPTLRPCFFSSVRSQLAPRTSGYPSPIFYLPPVPRLYRALQIKRADNWLWETVKNAPHLQKGKVVVPAGMPPFDKTRMMLFFCFWNDERRRRKCLLTRCRVCALVSVAHPLAFTKVFRLRRETNARGYCNYSISRTSLTLSFPPDTDVFSAMSAGDNTTTRRFIC